MPAEAVQSFLSAWIPLFVAIDPLGMVAVFLGLTSELEAPARRQAARAAVFTAAGVCAGFMVLGQAVFNALGITVADFQIAGGLVLLVLAGRDLVAPERRAESLPGGLGVVPLGLPLIAGPAALTALLILMDQVGWPYTLAALAVNLGLLYLALRFSQALARALGRQGLRAASKIVALLLAAFAVSIIRRGVMDLAG
jgi:multiple antibiotic resistance protein